MPAVAPVSRSRVWRTLGWWLVAFLIACAWDRAAWLCVKDASALRWLESSLEWDRLRPLQVRAIHGDVRAMGASLIALVYALVYFTGRIWPWIGLAVCFIFRHWAGTDGAKVRDGLRRGTFVFLVPAIAGLAAEVLKLLTHRARPEDADGFYQFHPWAGAGVLSPEFWSTSSLGLASSHAAVAVGGALAAGLLMPRWRWPLLGLALLCALSRVAVGAHFVSDVVAGVALAFAAYRLVYLWDRRNNRGLAIA